MKRLYLLMLAAGLLAALSLGCAGAEDDGDGNGNGNVCSVCEGRNVSGPGEPPDNTVSCMEGSGAFSCNCTTESGRSETLFRSEGSCEG